jgi:hypothetical protein
VFCEPDEKSTGETGTTTAFGSIGDLFGYGEKELKASVEQSYQG